MFTPVDLQRLPVTAVSELALIMEAIDNQLTWPVQTMLILGPLTPKRTAEDKAIGLVSMLGRLRSLIREPWVRDWSREHAAAWDAAVEDNSCLHGGAHQRH